jgi:hypothetical protein
MIAKCYPEEIEADETLSVKQRPTSRNAPNDPVFWDLVADLGSGDLDERLSNIEQRLDRIWVLLEKVLRTLEIREGAHRAER